MTDLSLTEHPMRVSTYVVSHDSRSAMFLGTSVQCRVRRGKVLCGIGLGGPGPEGDWARDATRLALWQYLLLHSGAPLAVVRDDNFWDSAERVGDYSRVLGGGFEDVPLGQLLSGFPPRPKWPALKWLLDRGGLVLMNQKTRSGLYLGIAQRLLEGSLSPFHIEREQGPLLSADSLTRTKALYRFLAENYADPLEIAVAATATTVLATDSTALREYAGSWEPCLQCGREAW